MVGVRDSNLSAMVDMVSEWSVSETAISVLWWTWSVDGQCHRQQCQCYGGHGQCHRQQCQCYGGHGQWMVSVRDSSVSAMVDMVSAACPLTDVVVH